MNNETGNPETEPFHSSQEVFTIAVMVVTFLVGVPGNLMVIWITSFKMKWTVNTIWFWNLALADVTCCLFIPLSIAQLFYAEWLYGAALCKIVPVIVHLTMFASVFTLVAISVDRCLLVVQPVWAQNKRGLGMAWVMCGVIWMLSFLMCLPAVMHRETILHDNMTYCIYIYDDHLQVQHVDDYTTQNYEHVTTTFSVSSNDTIEDHNMMYPVHSLDFTITYTRMIFGFLIPLLIVSTSYILLASKVQKSRLYKVGRKTGKVAFGIVVVFFVTWAPYHIIGVTILYFYDETLHILDRLSVSLVYFNSCMNPILYIFMGKAMKKRMKRSIGMFMKNAFSEEVSRSTERTRSKLTTEDSIAF